MNARTPEEARSLWCPMVRLAAVTEGGSGVMAGQTVMNRLQKKGERTTTPDAAVCIADRCAMWRWERTTRSVRQTTVGASGVDVPTYEQRTVRTHGYCGLAPLHAQP